MLILIILAVVIGGGFLEAWAVMLVEGALAHSMGYILPTLSYESSLWLAVLVGILTAGVGAASKS